MLNLQFLSLFFGCYSLILNYLCYFVEKYCLTILCHIGIIRVSLLFALGEYMQNAQMEYRIIGGDCKCEI